MVASVFRRFGVKLEESHAHGLAGFVLADAPAVTLLVLFAKVGDKVHLANRGLIRSSGTTVPVRLGLYLVALGQENLFVSRAGNHFLVQVADPDTQFPPCLLQLLPTL